MAQLHVAAGRLDVVGELSIGKNLASGKLTLSGGELHAAVLSKGSFGTFDFTGGVLHADSVTFNLARAVGPALAGLALATLGAAFAFSVNAVSPSSRSK